MRQAGALLLFAYSLIGQSIPFPGPGTTSVAAVIAPVQHKADLTEPVNLTTQFITFTGNVTSGNLIVIGLFFCSDGPCTGAAYTNTIAVTDTLGTTYQQDTCQLTRTTPSYRACIFSGHVGSTAADTVTVTYGATVHSGGMYGTEWSGVVSSSWLDQVGDNGGTTSNPSATTAGSTVASGELVYCLVAANHAVTIGAGYSALNSGGSFLADEYKIAGSPASQTGTWTASAGNWIAAIATYKHQ